MSDSALKNNGHTVVSNICGIIEDLKNDLLAEDNIISQQVKIRKNFAEKKESIEKLETELEELRRSKKEAEAESENISTVGVQKLQDLILSVNDKFSSYFADLGYAGQVRAC